MTPYVLLHALAEELREATKQFKFIAQAQPDKKISIYEQAIPTEDFEEDTFYPLICVELLNIEDAVEMSTAAFLLTIGCYAGERDSGWLDLLNLMEEVREYLLGRRIIGKHFLLQEPLYSSIVEPVSDSFIFANLFVTFQIPRVNILVPNPHLK